MSTWMANDPYAVVFLPTVADCVGGRFETAVESLGSRSANGARLFPAGESACWQAEFVFTSKLLEKEQRAPAG